MFVTEIIKVNRFKYNRLRFLLVRLITEIITRLLSI